MSNYKVKVNNEAESKEVQEFLKNKGYSRKYSNFTLRDGWICINEKMDILCVCHSQAGSELNDYKELTIPQLKDLVVLKRNSIDDATHADQDNWKWYIGADSYVWQAGNSQQLNRWDKFSLDYVDLKPIEKPMKEYINKTTGEYRKTADVVTGEQWVEVPDGMNFAYLHSHRGYIYFLQSGLNFTNHKMVWKRPTQPEELPFVDDEPTLNDTYAEIEQVRQKHSHYFKDVSHLNQIDVYDVLKLFEVTDPCLQHIVKKALCAGNRGHKDLTTDLQNILDTAIRAIELNK